MEEERKETPRQRRARQERELLTAASQAVEELVRVMRDEEVKPELRVSCAVELLNRAYGKPEEGKGARKSAPKGERDTVRILMSEEAAKYGE